MRVVLVLVTVLATVHCTFSDETKDKVERLIKQVRSTDHRVKAQAAKQLGELGEKAESAARAICECLRYDNEDLKLAAVEALEKIDPIRSKIIIDAAISKNHIERMEAFEKMRRAGKDCAAAAGYLLPEMEQARNANKPYIEQLKTFVAIVDPKEGFAVCQQILKGKRSNERTTAFVAVCGWAESNEAMRPQCIAAIIEHHETHTTGAIDTLQKLAKDSKSALPLLRKLKVHPDGKIRDAATGAIRAIEEATKQ